MNGWKFPPQRLMILMILHSRMSYQTKLNMYLRSTLSVSNPHVLLMFSKKTCTELNRFLPPPTLSSPNWLRGATHLGFCWVALPCGHRSVFHLSIESKSLEPPWSARIFFFFVTRIFFSRNPPCPLKNSGLKTLAFPFEMALLFRGHVCFQWCNLTKSHICGGLKHLGKTCFIILNHYDPFDLS